MTDIWAVYDRLVRAKTILGDVGRYSNQETLNDAIDAAFGILYNRLPLLAEYIEDMEELK